MKSIIDHGKVNSRASLSNFASIGGLLMLLASVVLPNINQSFAVLASLLLVIGLAMSMVGIYFANRWARKPRPEEGLDRALKGLGEGNRLYHYPRLPCDHVLLTPFGVVVLETVSLGGSFTCKDGRWQEKMTIGRALRWIVEEHLGDPVKAALSSENHLKRRLAEQIDKGDTIPVKSAVVFTHPAATLELESTPIPVCKWDKLKRHIPTTGERLLPEIYEVVRQYFDEKT